MDYAKAVRAKEILEIQESNKVEISDILFDTVEVELKMMDGNNKRISQKRILNNGSGLIDKIKDTIRKHYLAHNLELDSELSRL